MEGKAGTAIVINFIYATLFQTKVTKGFTTLSRNTTTKM